jgi:phytoene synthase
MTFSPEAVRAGYTACRRVARQSGSNFYASFFFLPADKRRAMDALYAFMRQTDDLADNSRPLAERRQSLAQWRAQLSAALDAEDSLPDRDSKEDRLAAALLPAVADCVRRFQIPVEHLTAVIDGVEMDLDGRRYETFDELAEYCRRVASAVGLACIHIWGFRDPAAIEPARQCGLALQLTNILRDLKEDCRDGRVYLPLEDFRHCGYSVDDLAAGVADERFVRLVRLEIDRAKSLYRAGAELVRWLDPDGRRMFAVMVGVYHRLLEKIDRDPAALLARRIRVSGWEKLRIAARCSLWPPRKVALP